MNNNDPYNNQPNQQPVMNNVPTAPQQPMPQQPMPQQSMPQQPMPQQPTMMNVEPTNMQPMTNNAPINQPVPEQKKKNSALIAIIAFIGVVVVLYILYYAATFLLSFSAVSSTVNNAKAATFADTAEEFANSARMKLEVSCDGVTKKEYKISELDMDGNYSTSAFGNPYDQDASFVRIEAKEEDGKCKRTCYVYLTDGKYSVGTPSNPIPMDELNASSVTKK